MIKQVYNENETVQTSLAVKVDNVLVHYRQCKNFAYEFWVYGVYSDEAAKIKEPWLDCSVTEAKQAIEEVVQALCSQSYDHGAEWRETYREEEFSDVTRYAIYSVRVSFRVRDAF